MVRDCLRNKTSFAVVTILPEGETDPKGNFPFANIGTLVNIVDADVSAIGLIMIRCIGQHRVKIESFTQQPDGLVIGEVNDISNDVSIPVPEDLNPSVNVLKQLLKTLADQAAPASQSGSEFAHLMAVQPRSLLYVEDLGTNSPPQFGHTLLNFSSAQALQNVHSNVQILASLDSLGRWRSQHSQLGRS